MREMSEIVSVENSEMDVSFKKTNSQTSLNKSQSGEVFDFELFKSKILKSYKQTSISKKMRKYFKKRYQLFSRFDSGILMDNESWFSVTPEKVAKHIAFKAFKKSNNNADAVVLDAFCGSGGNTIQFANYFNRVISCDIDFTKLQCAQNNAKVYSVEDKITFLMQDFFHLHETLKIEENALKIDIVFLSPPWGGVSYFQNRQANIDAFPIDGFKIYLYCLHKLKCRNIIYFLPRNCNLEQVVYMAGVGGRVEIEQNFLDSKFVAITAYYGDMCQNI